MHGLPSSLFFPHITFPFQCVFAMLHFVVSKEIREKVRQMLQHAECLVTKSCFHGDGIRQWATAVEKRYKDFSSRMNKYRVRLETKLGYPTVDQDVSFLDTYINF